MARAALLRLVGEPGVRRDHGQAGLRGEAQERAVTYLSRKWDSIDKHYHFSDGHLASVKGYEFYGKMTKTYSKMKDPTFREKATDFYVKI